MPRLLADGHKGVEEVFVFLELRVDGPERSVVQVDQLIRRGIVVEELLKVEVTPPSAAAPLEPPLVASPVDQNAPHGLGGGREKVASAVP